ncbi:hypothetical protein EG68_11435 [Paragonimus skrjabini miyazakii]|uniref:ELYS beta-propeller domain-containing protein n=1 Tax=Paragonimus skrjabini miyazakii TaxID=59628 RepID=A0A8S9YIX8_9TREM|nr:hypothetical protein EG68_11435 [Paragonimus skrjabini miyazakii]
MQPVHLETVGYFSHYLTAGPHSASTQLVFSSHENVVCLFTARRLDCYIGRPGWSKVFSWSPDRNRLLNSVLLPDTSAQWVIAKVLFPPTRPADVGKPCPIALCVLLVNETQDFSFICYFPDVQDCGQRVRVISTHGLLSACEWIYPLDDCEMTTTSPESGTILAESMDLSHCEPKRIPTLKSVVPSFSGCLAVGFRQGYVSLLDLCLDWSPDNSESAPPEAAVAMEKSQFLQVVSTGERVSSFDESTLEHTLVYLDSSAVRWNMFHYKSANGKTVLSLDATSVYVSALHYIPNSQTLVVGFSFGGWQLWSLRSLHLEFSLRHLSITTPVTCVAFQEPSDDPRYCCYLWIGWQSKSVPDDVSSHGSASSSHATSQ